MSERLLIVAIPLGAAAVFYIDWQTEPVIAAGFLYSIVLAPAYFLRQAQITWVAALVCSILVIIGYSPPPVRGESWYAAANAALALVAIWTCAGICLIAQRRHDALRTRTERAERMISGIRDYAIFMLDPAGRIMTWNKGAQHLTGYAADEVIGQPFSRFHVSEDVASGAPERQLQIAAADGCFDQEGWCLRKDGSRFWAHATITAVRDSQRNLIGFTKVTRDMTELKAAAEALRKSEAHFRSAVESAPVAMVMTDQAGRMVLVNKLTETMFGYSRGELFGKTVEMLVPARFRVTHPRLRGEFFNQPEARRMGPGRDLYALRKDGSEFPVEIGLNPFETADGVFVLSAILDITERKRAEERFRATVESAPMAMVMTDRTGQIVLVNRQAESLFGYRREELLNQHIEVLVPERFRGAHPDLRAGFHAQPVARQMGAGRDLNALRKDGSEFPVEIALNPIKTGEGVFVLSAIVDLTLRKKAEEMLKNANEELERRVAERTAALAQQAKDLARSKEALERSNAELQRFAYIASHDLQTPLRSISGFTQLLHETYADRLDKRADDWIRRTVESTKRMQELIQDLLSYARIETHTRTFAPVNCAAVLRDALDMLYSAIEETGAEVTYGDLPTVMGDRLQLAQLFQNLIMNGIVYHKKDEPPRIDVSVETAGEEYLFSVRDNGIGIDPKHHDRIFEIFQRLHTQRTYPGTGIGLAVCRRVVHRHGGRIWVESEPGKGSTFRFTIPVKGAAEDEQ